MTDEDFDGDRIWSLDEVADLLNGVPDGYDDPNIDAACYALREVIEHVTAKGSITADELKELIDSYDYWYSGVTDD